MLPSAGLAQPEADDRPLPEILQAIVTGIETHDPELLGSLLLLDPEGRTLHHGASAGLPASFHAAIERLPVGPAVGSCGRTAWLGEEVATEDLAQDPRWDGHRHLTDPLGVHHCWSFPIIGAAGTVLGTLTVYGRRARLPSEEDRRFLRGAAERAGIAIERRDATLTGTSSSGDLTGPLVLRSVPVDARRMCPSPAVRVDEGQSGGTILAAFPAGLVLDCLSDGVIATTHGRASDEGPLIVYANQAACDITGYTRQELVGRSPRLLQGPDTSRTVLRRLHDDLDGGRPFAGQTPNYRKDGTRFVMEWSISILPAADGQPEFFIAIQRDATLPARRLLEAEHQARTDALTGLPNRKHMDEILQRGGWLSTRARSAVVIDIDHFKDVNDTYGHLVGDEVLRLFADRLASTARNGDLVARWGGEEFCVLTLGDGDDAASLARRIVTAIADRPFSTSAGAVTLTASAGSASFAEGRTTALDLLGAADGAMYAAKRRGRNRAVPA